MKERKTWIEIGGAGIFRPEVVVPLLGEYIPVLAWGPGFDRLMMDYYQIKDLREMYSNDLTKLKKAAEEFSIIFSSKTSQQQEPK